MSQSNWPSGIASDRAFRTPGANWHRFTPAVVFWAETAPVIKVDHNLSCAGCRVFMVEDVFRVRPFDMRWFA